MGAGSGGSSGKVDYPEYIKTIHQELLDDFATDSLTTSLVEIFNTTIGGTSPYASYVTNLDPNLALTFGSTDSLTDKIFVTLQNFLSVDFDTKYANYQAGSTVAELIDAVSTTLDDEIDLNILPKFQANLRSMGAINSSAFVIGESLIWDSKVKALAKERLTIESLGIQNRELAIKIVNQYIEFKKTCSLASAEIAKYYYSLKGEIDNHYAEMGSKDATWDLELFTHIEKGIACINGSAVSQGVKGMSKIGAGLTGALAGAATGAMIGAAGGPIGWMGGAAIGLAAGLLG